MREVSVIEPWLSRISNVSKVMETQAFNEC